MTTRVKASCIKVPYTQRAADKVAAELKIDAFQCPDCGHWHVGHGLDHKPKSGKVWIKPQYASHVYGSRIDKILKEINTAK